MTTESERNVNNMTMFTFRNTILLRGVRTRKLVKNARLRTKISEFMFSILTTTIGA
jgi:hypothetical protein